MRLLIEFGGGMFDEVLVIFVILVSYIEGKVVIGFVDVLFVLVDVIVNGLFRNKENVVVVLVYFCLGDYNYLVVV